MLNTLPKKIVIIGCGNVAWHIAKKLHVLKQHQLLIYNHKANKALTDFKKEFTVETFSRIKKVIPDADAYFICVNDASIDIVMKQLVYLPDASHFFVTSGSFNPSELKSKFKNIAIFYPLQTFSKNDALKWKNLSLIIDCSNSIIEAKTILYAHYFTKKILKLNYQQRLKLHLAAVFVNNFTNSLFVEADKLVKSIRKDLDIKLLLPLIKQGTKKIKKINPVNAQTGPAKRNDISVMGKHLALLQNDKNLKPIYKLISNLISQQQKHNAKL